MLRTARESVAREDGMLHDEFSFADEDFWSTPLHRAPDVVDRLLAARDADAFVVLAPKFVALDTRRGLPVVVGHVAPARELARRRFEERAVVIVTALESGVVRAFGAKLDEKSRLPPAPGFDGGLDPSWEGTSAQVMRVELWDGAGSRWPPGTYALRAIMADRISDPTTVTVGAATSTYDPAVSKHLEQERIKAGPAKVWPPPDPSGRAPRYHEAEESPAVPKAPGIALTAARVVILRGHAQCLVHGAYRLPLRRAQHAAHGAVVPITLVLTGSEDPAPHLIPLQVPSFDAVDPANPPETVTGHFTLDLFQLARIAASPQSYFLYAFSGADVGGPVPIAIVAESAIAEASGRTVER